MNANLISVESIDNLESLFVESHRTPVVLFKHSTTCSISSGVLRDVSSVDGEIHMIVVQTHRTLANTIAEWTGVCHESPQAIVLKDGQPVYSASHYDIEPQVLQSYLAQVDA